MNERERRLAEIREREKAASPGPWLVSWCQVPKYPDGHDVYFFGFRDKHGALANPDEHGFVDPDGSGADDDWTFLQHARDDIPYLLSLVARLADENQALRLGAIQDEGPVEQPGRRLTRRGRAADGGATRRACASRIRRGAGGIGKTAVAPRYDAPLPSVSVR